MNLLYNTGDMSTQFIAKPRDNMYVVFSTPSKPSRVCGIRRQSTASLCKNIVAIPFAAYTMGH